MFQFQYILGPHLTIIQQLPPVAHKIGIAGIRMAKEKMGLEDMHHRQVALMKAMLLYPLSTEYDLGNMIGCSAATIKKWKKDPVFKQEFAKYSSQELTKAQATRKSIDDHALQATEKALTWVDDHMKSTEEAPIPLEIQLDTVKTILAQGHAKAVDRSAHLSASVELPPEALSALLDGLRDYEKPFLPSKRLKQIEGDGVYVEAEPV